MRDEKERRRHPVDGAGKRASASRSSTYRLEGPAAEASDELTRLIRIIARQAAQEAFSAFRDVLDAGAIKAPSLPDPSKPGNAQEGCAGNERAPPDPGERLLSVAEVALRLDVSEKTVRRMVASGDLPAQRVGKLIRVSEGVLTAYLLPDASQKGRAKQ
jgi:excisionase family DNA binding protein